MSKSINVYSGYIVSNTSIIFFIALAFRACFTYRLYNVYMSRVDIVSKPWQLRCNTAWSPLSVSPRTPREL